MSFVRQPMPNNEEAQKCKAEIQPSGYLMVLNVDDLQVLQASDNFSRIVVGGANTLLRHTFEDLFGAAIASNLRRRVNKEGRILMLISGDFPLFDQRKFNCLVQTVGNKIIVEMEESHDSAEPSADQTEALSDAVASIGQSANITDLIQAVPGCLKKLTGFDRVVVYQLDQALTGQVVAELVSPGMDSLLNLYFPAEDISFETCDSYCRTTVRAVADTDYEPSTLIGDQTTIDLSNCALASVSQSHIQQLRASGIGASLSISIVCNSRLWGLISCHHRTARALPHWLRSYCEVVGKLISLKITAFEESADRDLKEKLRRFFDGINANPTRASLEAELLRNAPTILEVFDGKGLALLSNENIETYPRTPERTDIALYVEWLKASAQKNFFVEDNLRSKFPLTGMLETASGVITMSFPNHDLSLHIFRPELTQTFTWASSLFMSVDKERTNKPHFEVLRQTIEKHSAPWALHQMFMAQIFFDSMRSVLGNIDFNESADG